MVCENQSVCIKMFHETWSLHVFDVELFKAQT